MLGGGRPRTLLGTKNEKKKGMKGMKNISDIEISDEFLARLPKTDLHVHLDGSLRLNTILELAEERGVTLPSVVISMVSRSKSVRCPTRVFSTS